MSDLISRNALIQEIEPLLTWELLDKINKMPAVDAVPVVRCKNCKHHEAEEPGMVYCPHQIGGWMPEEWFCAMGE